MSDLSLFTSLLLGGHSHNLVKCVVQHSLVDQPCWPNYKLGYQLPSFPLTCWKSEKERQSAVRKGFVAAVSGLHRPPNLTFLLIWFSWNMKFSYFDRLGWGGLSAESRKVWINSKYENQKSWQDNEEKLRVITINFLRALNMKLLEEVKPGSDVC